MLKTNLTNIKQIINYLFVKRQKNKVTFFTLLNLLYGTKKIFFSFPLNIKYRLIRMNVAHGISLGVILIITKAAVLTRKIYPFHSNVGNR